MGKGISSLSSLAVLAGLAFAPAAQAAPVELVELPVCTQAVPGAVSADNKPVNIEVRVLLDGVSLARAKQVVTRAQAAYNSMRITLRPSYAYASFGGTDATQLIAQAKAFYGGARPANTDLVYVLTNKDLTDAVNGSGVAGLADCIGGVAHANNAFAVGEAADYPPLLDLGLYALMTETGAKVMAHEIGHLLGAHHHYANCAEGLAPGDSPCTLMFNTIEFQKLQFSLLNGLVVRGHAQVYAAP